MHDRACRADFILGHTAVDLGEMAHGLKQRTHVAIAKAPGILVLGSDRLMPRFETPIELMSEYEPEHGKQRFCRCHASQRADDFAPVQTRFPTPRLRNPNG